MEDYVGLLRDRLKIITDAAAAHQKDIILAADAAYHAREQDITVGCLVLLCYPARKKPSKLAPSFLGPFQVTSALDNKVYELTSLVEGHTLNAHISRLRLYHGDIEHARELAAADHQEYIVEKIVEHHTSDAGRLEFRIRWLGYGSEDDTWQPYDGDLAGNVSVEQYIDDNGLRPQARADCRVTRDL